MGIRFTRHARQRMKERGISLAHIQMALRKPDTKSIVGEFTYKARKKISGKTIEVVYRSEDAQQLIITVYYLV